MSMLEFGCTWYNTVGSSAALEKIVWVGLADLSIYGGLRDVGCHVVWISNVITLEQFCEIVHQW